jgi:hypothetical protein
MESFLLKLLEGEGKAVRGTEHEGNLQISVFDYINRGCARQATSTYGNTTFHRLLQDSSKDKHRLEKLYIYLQFPGKGQRKTPCMTLQGLLVLTDILGSKISDAFRHETFSVLQRYLDGDTSMCAEILENQSLGKRKSYANFVDRVAKRAQVDAENRAHELPAVSYVYATKSEAFPNLIKIGRSCNLAARLSSLNTSCAPAPHAIIASAMTLDSVRDEALAHAFFASARKEGEFFEVTQEDVESFFANHITNQYQLERAKHIAGPSP